MSPACPICQKSSTPGPEPQGRDRYARNVDLYTCRDGHTFEAPVPLTLKNGYAVRADIE